MTKNSHYLLIVALMVLLVAGAGFAGCTGTTPATPQTTPVATVTTTQPVSTLVVTSVVTVVPVTIKPTGPPQTLLIATTTSLYDTGLLDYLQPMFEQQYGSKLKITSQGTGKAIELAKRGDAAILLVHDPASEMQFMENGTGLNRRSFADNYFIIVGPASDPAGIKGMTPEDAFKKIMADGKNGTANVAFVSRGDGSGTHSAEKRIWSNAKYNYAKDVQNSGKWYVEAGKGMGETLQMASEKGAYTLTDEGTYLAYKGKLNLEPVVSSGDSLLNVYSVMSVYNAKQPVEKIKAANNFVNFLIAPNTQAAIAAYGKDKYGKGLFTPMSAGVPKGIPGGIPVDYTTPAVATKPLIIFSDKDLTASFTKLAALYVKTYPDTDVQMYFGTSSVEINKITKNGETADAIAVADPTLIETQMYPKYTEYYVKFASITNATTGIKTEYGSTVPTVAVNPSAGIQWIQLLLSSDGQDILTGNGLPPIVPPKGIGAVPSSLMPPVVKG